MTLKAESRKLKSLKFEVRNPKRCPPVYFIQRNLLTSRLHSISVGQALGECELRVGKNINYKILYWSKCLSGCVIRTDPILPSITSRKSYINDDKS